MKVERFGYSTSEMNLLESTSRSQPRKGNLSIRNSCFIMSWVKFVTEISGGGSHLSGHGSHDRPGKACGGDQYLVAVAILRQFSHSRRNKKRQRSEIIDKGRDIPHSGSN
jgi:hypothetical protein